MTDALALPLVPFAPAGPGRARHATARPRGDGDAFRSLYREHAEALLAYARHFTPDRMAAEDALQETFLRAWRHLPQLVDDDRPPRPWLRTVLRRILIDSARAGRNRPTRLVEDALVDEGSEVAFDAVVDRSRLATALRRLSAPHREVLVGTYYRDLPAERLATDLGIPVGTVRSRLHYGLLALREQLRDADR
jgi:RNA polymerase sigma-70 factor (ECF subfamily)